MRKQEAGAHTIPSFAGYLNKVFDFRSSVASLSDARHDPDISPQSVFLSAFYPKSGSSRRRSRVGTPDLGGAF